MAPRSIIVLPVISAMLRALAAANSASAHTLCEEQKASAAVVPFYTTPTSMEQFPYFLGAMLALFMFAGFGNASTFKQMPMLFPPRQAGGVIGWTGAMAAYGPFSCGLMLGYSFDWFGTFNGFFYWAAVFYAVCTVINWWFYARRDAEQPC